MFPQMTAYPHMDKNIASQNLRVANIPAWNVTGIYVTLPAVDPSKQPGVW